MVDFLKEALCQRTFIAATPEKVYETITTGEGWDAFFTTGTEIDLKEGGEMWFRWKDWGPNFYTTNAKCKVLKFNKPDLFVFEWYPVGDDTATTIEIKLEGKYGGTVVELKESGYPNTEVGRIMILECACGWGEALTLLKFYLEKGVTYTPPQKDI